LHSMKVRVSIPPFSKLSKMVEIQNVGTIPMKDYLKAREDG